MSKYKLEFTLKQHTPIIHFQAKEAGATLRATELKPKLDRFLMKKLKLTKIVKKNNKDVEVLKEEYKSWFIGGGKEHLSLDYKMKVNSNKIAIDTITKKVKKYNRREEKDIVVDDGFPCFFATMGKEWKDNPKFFSIADDLTIEILSYQTQLIEIIEEFFPSFIFNTNFGTRQSKGFGSFSVIKINDKYHTQKNNVLLNFKIDLNQIDKKVFPFIKYVDDPSTDFIKQKQLFTIIDIFYKTLRSGINLRGKFYFKSLLYMYAKENNIAWDKKYFKQQFLGDSHKDILNERKKHNNPEILDFSTIGKEETTFLVRDLLGLATTQEWMSYKCRVRHPKEKGEDKLENTRINENKVKRFKSPITIKPIRIDEDTFEIFILLNPIDEKLFNEKITVIKTFDEGYGRDKREIIDKKIENLEFWNGFSLDNYFSFIDEFEIDKHIDKKFEKHPYYTLINNIYTDLKASI